MQKWYEWCQTRRDLQQTPVWDPHCCWSQTEISGTGESGESDVNRTDWWRTVKLPFVKEKQEASCGRPSLSGWEETAGRKPHLRSGERLSCGLQGNSRLSISIGLAFWPELRPSSFQYHCFSHMYQSYHIKGCVSVCFPSFFSLVTKISTTVCLIITAARPFAAVPWSKSYVLEQRFFCDLLLIQQAEIFFFLSSSNEDSMKPELQRHGSTIWFMNQFKYRIQQLVMHVDFLTGTISN